MFKWYRRKDDTEAQLLRRCDGSTARLDSGKSAATPIGLPRYLVDGKGRAMTTAASPVLHARFRDRNHPLLAAAACTTAVLICLAALPMAFVMMDHTLVVAWSNALFDLVGL